MKAVDRTSAKFMTCAAACRGLARAANMMGDGLGGRRLAREAVMLVVALPGIDRRAEIRFAGVCKSLDLDGLRVLMVDVVSWCVSSWCVVGDGDVALEALDSWG